MSPLYDIFEIMSTRVVKIARYTFATLCEKPNMAKEIGERVKTAREAAGMSQEALGSLIGRDKSAISLMESGKRGISVQHIARLAKALDVTEDWIAFGTGPMTSGAPPKRPADVFTPKIIPGADLVSQQRDLPVYAAAKGGDGHIIITFDPISYMKMPAVLQGVKGGYGLLLTGDSMIPAYRPGETALINPNLPPARDEDVILYHTDDMNENEAIIKRLIGFNDREWLLEQYNPASEFKEFRADWRICHRVVGKYNTR